MSTDDLNADEELAVHAQEENQEPARRRQRDAAVPARFPAPLFAEVRRPAEEDDRPA